MNNTITYNNLKNKLNRNKSNETLSLLIKFFLSKSPEYWNQRPDETYAVYTDLIEIEKNLNK